MSIEPIAKQSVVYLLLSVGGFISHRAVFVAYEKAFIL